MQNPYLPPGVTDRQIDEQARECECTAEGPSDCSCDGTCQCHRT